MLPLLLLSLSTFLATITGLPSAIIDGGTEQSTIKENLKISSIRDILVDNEIIGDVLDEFEPKYSLDLAYPKYHEPVMLGNDIPVKSVSKRPTFSFHPLQTLNKNRNLTFTLVMTDPDATSRNNPKMSEMCHWILTNLTTPVVSHSTHLTTEKLMKGELESYYPPAPPEKTGKHRYVFVLLEGDATNIKAPKERPHWGYGKVRHGVRDWAEENSLEVVGANFFFAQNKKQ